MDINGIASVATAAVTLLAVGVAIMALRRASADAKAARTAELSWNVYQAYDSPELREGRRALNTVSRKQPVPATGKEFGDMYVTHSYKGPAEKDAKRHAKEVSTGSIRRMLRFYHQIGILLDEGLIDAEFVFPLIGYGLKTSESGIRVATEWYQNYYGGASGNEKAPTRTIYEQAIKLPDKCSQREEARGRDHVAARRRRALWVIRWQARPGRRRRRNARPLAVVLTRQGRGKKRSDLGRFDLNPGRVNRMLVRTSCLEP
jgi:hypothetical protein